MVLGYCMLLSIVDLFLGRWLLEIDSSNMFKSTDLETPKIIIAYSCDLEAWMWMDERKVELFSAYSWHQTYGMHPEENQSSQRVLARGVQTWKQIQTAHGSYWFQDLTPLKRANTFTHQHVQKSPKSIGASEFPALQCLRSGSRALDSTSAAQRGLRWPKASQLRGPNSSSMLKDLYWKPRRVQRTTVEFHKWENVC